MSECVKKVWTVAWSWLTGRTKLEIQWRVTQNSLSLYVGSHLGNEEGKGSPVIHDIPYA